MQKLLIILGIVFILLALAWPILKKIGFGRLPGDIIFRKGHFTFYFPVTTCIIISLLIMIILWFFNK
ncbi:DUF2905 domain-containing protein [Legionella israelensis]|uniref:DUF2905 domain-containing protein n=1 Tax=Legionella israelensis TaxID=454 RepID=A0A0W0WBR3_9GAMM|nr:DUF2905 domain-containing protein [Legionella israelensis]KTD29752.1 hypothetical protein Lisr_0812 [Legionella israelensis]QBR83680.1 DUF2905 domain-containing protein [Legionella israelensis]QBS08877.1 DUF2905 domain-containing protein [Legionella israelensis]QDP73140.1 DUF2905 domain-containing protein [Legionella israelensis]SCY02878.1 Protein of unknown function [Legionella israelensis DSM 19235]